MQQNSLRVSNTIHHMDHAVRRGQRLDVGLIRALRWQGIR